MDSLSANKKIAKNTMALYVRMGITMIISFFTTRVTLEILGAEDYGLNNVVASVVSLFSFINGSMGTAVQRFFSFEIGKKKEQNLTRVFGTAIYLHIIVAIITLIIAEIFALFFLHKLNIPVERMFAAKVVFQISIASMLLNILNVPYQAILRAREEFSKIAILDIVQSFLRLGVLYLLYIIDFDKLIVLSILTFGITLFYCFGIIVIASKYKETKFQILRDKEYINNMVGFMSMLIMTVLASVANTQGIVILVNLFFCLTINAAYAIAFQVATMIETFAMNFKQAIVPQLMQAFGANDTTRMNNLVFSGTKVTFMLMMLISIPIIFEADYILKLWLKEPPDYAYIFTILLVIKINIDTFYYFVYQAVHASGKIKQQQILISISYALSVVVIYSLFKTGVSFYYAAIIPILFSFIRNLIVIYNAMKSIGLMVVQYLFNVILPCVGLAFTLTIISLILTRMIDTSFLRLILVFMINAILTILLGFFMVLKKEERNVFLFSLFRANK